MNRKSHCDTTLHFINCMSDLLSNVCESNDPKVIYFLSTMKDEIQIYKNNYRAHCQSKNFRLKNILSLAPVFKLPFN